MNDQRIIDILHAEWLLQEYEDIAQNARDARDLGLNGLAIGYAIHAYKVMQKREAIINRLIFGI